MWDFTRCCPVVSKTTRYSSERSYVGPSLKVLGFLIPLSRVQCKFSWEVTTLGKRCCCQTGCVYNCYRCGLTRMRQFECPVVSVATLNVHPASSMLTLRFGCECLRHDSESKFTSKSSSPVINRVYHKHRQIEVLVTQDYTTLIYDLIVTP